jgi:tRNA-dihydrouridine synthase
VTGGGSGAAILSNPRLAGEIARAAVRATGIPVTAKIRSGFGTEKETYLAVAEELFAAGIAAVTLHPRHRGQMFAGTADWTQIAALKRAFPGETIIGNGDVRGPGDAARMLAETGCDSVMIGRAAMGNPWIFGPFPTPGARRDLILRHGEEMFLRLGEHGIKEMRKHLAWYSRGIQGAAAFRSELPKVADPDSFRAVVGRFF